MLIVYFTNRFSSAFKLGSWLIMVIFFLYLRLRFEFYSNIHMRKQFVLYSDSLFNLLYGLYLRNVHAGYWYPIANRGNWCQFKHLISEYLLDHGLKCAFSLDYALSTFKALFKFFPVHFLSLFVVFSLFPEQLHKVSMRLTKSP